MSNLEKIKNAVIRGELDQIELLVKAAQEEKIPVKQILDLGLIAGMRSVGDCFKRNEVFIPEVMISAKAMQTGLKLIEPLLIGEQHKSAGLIVIGTVKGDLHDIGKNLVSMMLKGAGFEIIDLGIDVSPESFIAKVDQTKAKVVAMSALITTSMPFMSKTIALLKEKGLPVKTMVGGAPVTQQFAEEIGADGYAADAARSVDLALELYK
ncbi:MAG: corrinoid protein [Candidatus Omnitrophica bacterium]|nr:corrinoid protein [Candidatus Omnitrophota bacterium]MBU1924908.1 corrinoid protein [Candidatus Omnitrophota bacterium]